MSIVTAAGADTSLNHRFYSYDEYLALPRETTPWLIDSLIPKGGLINMFGRPKTGKSFGALGIAYAIADPSIDHWLDPSMKVMQHGKVMYLQVDTPRPAWMARIDLIEARHHYKPGGNLLFADTGSAPYPFDIMNPANHGWLRKQCDLNQPDLVIIDTLREVHGLDEDSSTAMRNVISRLVGAVTPSAMMLVSHSRKGVQDRDGKGGGHDDIMDAARGSSYVAGRMDMVIRLTDKHLYTKGRSSMDGKYAVRQEPGTGLLLPDYGVHEIEMEEMMKALIITPSANAENDHNKMKMLMVLYPDASKASITQKFNRLRGKAVEPPDPKKMKYTMADVARMLERVDSGTHPVDEVPMPKVTLTDEKHHRKARKPAEPKE